MRIFINGLITAVLVTELVVNVTKLQQLNLIPKINLKKKK